MAVTPVSQKKIEANRRNAARSTGPRTPEGKAVASRNATTHGLTARSPVVLDESPEEFEAFAQSLRDDLKPRGAMQTILVERIIHLSWKLERVPAAEAEAIRKREEEMPTKQWDERGERVPATASQVMSWDVSRGGALPRLQAYESRIERSLHANLRELAKLKRQRAEEAEEAEERDVQNEATAAVSPESAEAKVADEVQVARDLGRVNADLLGDNGANGLPDVGLASAARTG
jgi:hypothetical protein